MDRKRPKLLKRVPAEHPKLHGRWKSWLPQMRNDLTHLLGSREIFWELQEVARENSAILTPGSFFDWMCWNYMAAASVSARSFVDQSHNSHSLWRMLYEILENPGVISRAAHVKMYRGMQDLGNMTFNSVVGREKQYLPQRAIRADMRKLENASERIRRFVNKRIAHKTMRGEMRRLPRLNELDAALNTIDELLCKYNLLLTAQGMSTLHATRQYNWQEVLWEPWILKGSKLRPL